MIENFLMHQVILVGIFIILITSLNLALGYTGLLNLGHVAFFAIGAYTSALLVKAGVAFPIAFLCAGLFAGVFGFLVVGLVRNLKGDYLALATLGFHFIVISLLLNWQSLTRGPLGLPGIKKPEIFGIVFKSKPMYMLLVLVVCILSVWVMTRIVRSPFGRLMAATRDDEIGLRVLGKNTFRIKSIAMMVSAFFGGIAGSLFAHYISYIDPYIFHLPQIILLLTLVIAGGAASMKGSVTAAIVITLIIETLRILPLPDAILGPLREMSYAVILILILLLRPRGLFGRIDVA